MEASFHPAVRARHGLSVVPRFVIAGLPALDTTALHVAAIVTRLGPGGAK